jgi:hypothetical protein
MIEILICPKGAVKLMPARPGHGCGRDLGAPSGYSSAHSGSRSARGPPESSTEAVTPSGTSTPARRASAIMATA